MLANDRQASGARLRVLVVEDSAFFRTQLKRLLEAEQDIEVVGQATNGLEAVAQARALRPDLITMDVEMPVMDGISAVREIMRVAPTRIVMLSSLTREGAESTLSALDAGAIDFIHKRAITADSLASIGGSLRGRLRELVKGSPLRAAKPGAAPPVPSTPPVTRTAMAPAAGVAAPTGTARAGAFFTGRPLLVIGASTGGPAVLGDLLAALPARFPCPILVGVHIPGTFSRCFAERLDRRCALPVVEATAGARLVAGEVLVAPGGMQTRVVRMAGGLGVEVGPGPEEALYRPSLDLTFESIASSAGRGVLAVVLTGMGNDGTRGAAAITAAGGTVWAQDEASSAVFGMPASVIKAGLAADIVSSAEFAARLARGQ